MNQPLPFLKSSAVARLLGVPYWRISALIRWERIPTPPRDSSGDYVWFPEDVERARQFLESERRTEEAPHVS